MSSTSAPFGLRPAYHPSGVVRPNVGTITSAYNATIHQFQPIKIVADGSIEAAAAGNRFTGVFMGVEWTDSDGRRRYSNKWTAGTTGTDIVAYYTRDPAIVYEIQSDAALNQDDIGEQFDFTAASGNTTTGLCTQMLGVSTSAANAGLRLLGISPGANNAWGDTYVIAFVQISEHQFVADIAAI